MKTPDEKELIKIAIEHLRGRAEEIEKSFADETIEIDEHELGMRSGIVEALFFLKDLIGDESEEEIE